MSRITKTEDVRGQTVEAFKSEYFKQIEESTPPEVKSDFIFDLTNKKAFKIHLDKARVEEWRLWEWFKVYQHEAVVSTGGIRGAQNISYPWDVRFPLNQLGVALATVGKAMVLKDEMPNKIIHKMCSGEVRYNTESYIEIISRIQAAQGIVTHVPINQRRTSVWMTSFLIFMLDYDGGEYVTSSHALSSKIATKDLDNQGSQFVPEMSEKFVKKIEQILIQAETKGFDIELADADSSLIVPAEDGYKLYLKYLKNGVATSHGLALVKEQVNQGFKLMLETVGGCMFNIMKDLFEHLEIYQAFDFNNTEEDPFFHGVGKTMFNPIKKKEEFFDWGCDVTINEVVLTLGYEKLLADKEPGYMVLMTDPDGDRLVAGQVETVSRKAVLEELGISYFAINEEKLFVRYSPNQFFLLILNYYSQQLKEAGLWNNYHRFLVTTTPSAATWVEWAEKNKVAVINVPVGFKEIASIIKKAEEQMIKNLDKNVKIHDIYGKLIDLGKNPRLVFAGEESGGMIIGPEKLIRSAAGRTALSMREKSAAEASVIATIMAAYLYKDKKFLSEYFKETLEEFDIKWFYDLRVEKKLYNDSNANPEELKQDKVAGEAIRDKVDSFFLSLALSLRLGKIDLPTVKEILVEALPEVDFSKLENVNFVGDGTYFRFSDKFVEIRKSGTDAIIKSYFCGDNYQEAAKTAEAIVNYSGEITPKFKAMIDPEIYQNCQRLGLEILWKFQKTF
ncbi:MAG: hypothetical protein V1664_03135 [Candidatus Uhrbacteria bacterium]